MPRNVSFAVGIFLSFFIVSSGLPAFAAEAPATGRLDLVTTGRALNLKSVPGRSITGDIRIKNSGDNPERLKITVQKFSAVGETGNPLLMDPDPEDESLKWISFPFKTFELAPEEWKTVPATIRIPEEAAFAYYYAVTFSRADEQAPTDTAAIQGGVASLILLEIDRKGALRELELVDFKTSKKMYEYLPADFITRLKNTGNIHAVAKGVISITKSGKPDEVVMNLPVNKDGGAILPESTRAFNTAWTDGFPRFVEKVENGKAVRKLEWDFTKLNSFRIGKYSAHLLAVYDNGKQDIPLEADVTFWVFPWKIIGGAIILLLLLSYSLFSIVKKVWRATVKKKK
jgi:hypothetical protein